MSPLRPYGRNVPSSAASTHHSLDEGLVQTQCMAQEDRSQLIPVPVDLGLRTQCGPRVGKADSEPVPTPTSSVTPGKFNEETRVLKTEPSQGCDMGQMRKHTKELSPTLCTN